MQSDSSVLATSAPAEVPTTTTVVHDGGDETGGGGSNSGDDDKNIRVEEGDRLSYGANRWPRQETLALLKIRSDMDSLFRDSSLKGLLWEEVSRKLAELGFHRSAKKCKEKFENVYKYHKRTKEGRTGKSEGKTYRFFDQLEAFEISHHQSQPPPSLQPPHKAQAQAQPAAPVATTTITLPWSNPPTVSHATVPSTTNHHINNLVITQLSDPMIDSPMPLSSSQPLYPNQNLFPSSLQNLTSHLFSSSTSSSTASDEEIQGSRKRKRRWKDFFGRLTKDVIKKQEELQRKFLETVERREQERIAREESWRMQELARINREHEILIQERTTAAAKDTAVIAFLQKISGQQNSVQNLVIPPPLPPHSAASPLPPPAQAQEPAPAPIPVSVLTPAAPAPVTQPRPSPGTSLNAAKKDQNGQNNAMIGTSSLSSRWPKVEVQALIRLRTSLDIKYQENGPKGPLWEEISAGMQKLGYNRSAKRCKEKWENINKYFKKVKESNKKRPEDSKTCPYFHQLDALYKEKGKINDNSNTNSVISTTVEPLMVRPEQQWPLPQESHSLELNGRQKMYQTMEEDDDDDEDDEVETEEEDEGGGEFQVVASKAAAASPLGNGE